MYGPQIFIFFCFGANHGGASWLTLFLHACGLSKYIVYNLLIIIKYTNGSNNTFSSDV